MSLDHTSGLLFADASKMAPRCPWFKLPDYTQEPLSQLVVAY